MNNRILHNIILQIILLEMNTDSYDENV